MVPARRVRASPGQTLMNPIYTPSILLLCRSVAPGSCVEQNSGARCATDCLRSAPGVVLEVREHVPRQVVDVRRAKSGRRIPARARGVVAVATGGDIVEWRVGLSALRQCVQNRVDKA